MDAGELRLQEEALEAAEELTRQNQEKAKSRKSKKKDPLALAVAVYRNVSYDEAKVWLDAKEKAQRGSKLKIRKIPEVARLLLEQQAPES